MFLLLICVTRGDTVPRGSVVHLGRAAVGEEAFAHPESVSPRNGRSERSLGCQRSERVADLKLAIDVAVEELWRVERCEAEALASEEEFAAAALDELLCVRCDVSSAATHRSWETRVPHLRWTWQRKTGRSEPEERERVSSAAWAWQQQEQEQSPR